MLEGLMNQYERCRKEIKEKGFVVCKTCIMYHEGNCDLFPEITAMIPLNIKEEDIEDGESR